MPNTEQPTKEPTAELPIEPSAQQVPPKPTESAEERVFHPHRHGHVTIRPADGRVTHLDPGVVTFS